MTKIIIFIRGSRRTWMNSFVSMCLMRSNMGQSSFFLNLAFATARTTHAKTASSADCLPQGRWVESGARTAQVLGRPSRT
jgi:hypothetical protein